MTEQDIIIRDENSHWDRHYLAYARFHGNTPERQTERDRLRYPRCSMQGFIDWQRTQHRIFHCLNGRSSQAAELSAAEQAQFTAWLGRRFGSPATAPQESDRKLLAV